MTKQSKYHIGGMVDLTGWNETVKPSLPRFPVPAIVIGLRRSWVESSEAHTDEVRAVGVDGHSHWIPDAYAAEWKPND